MSQPSANGIASLFRGNPAPLQQRIQQEQQGKPGLPPDLHELMALNIVTNETDAVAKQKAMDQLAQMQGPQGKPPTIMESVQEQARQKMQAQAMQAQQQQQAMQAMMQQAGPGPVPEGTQFAEAQPSAQGIDELPVEFGLAGGGIVAFQKGGEGEYETPYDRMNRKNREEAESKKKDSDKPLDAQAAADQAALASLLETLRGGSESAGRAIADVATMIPRGLAGAYDTAVVRPMRAAGLNAAYLSPKLTPEGANPESMTPFSDVKLAREAKKEAATPQMTRPQPTEQTYVRKAGPMPAEKPIGDLKALAEADARKKQAARPPAPVAQAPAPVAAAPEATPAPESQAAKLLSSRLNVDPMAEREAEQARRRKEIGELDTSTHDRMIAELEKRKAQLEGPQDSFGQLMEYLGQIAATPRGMSSFEAGAAGAANLSKVQKARQLEQFDLSKQALEVSQKKIDAVRAFATEQYNVGKARFDQVYKEQFEAAKEITKDEGDARKLAQENTLKRLELEQAMKRSEMEIEQRKAEEKGRMARDRVPLEQQVFAGYLRKAGGDVVKANELMREAGVNERGATPTDRLRAAQSILNDYESTAEEKVMARREISQIMSGSKGAAAPAGGGKPITKAEYDKLPKGATYTAPDGTQRTKG